ncbi:MAG: hypothetical protein NC132_04275 [Corallococcus sp.]|nr:hypothetical protein [Corallococcus sp.]MCM1359876.1 hypothetical protein [Corallococcus sp.]MCM1395310.1 hypothetical protein [Corallococcus sp.]
MLNKKTEAVLNMLSTEVGYSYKVVKKQQLLDAMPKKQNLTLDELVSSVSLLKDNDYLTVKYQDKDEICLALTVKAESYLSGEQEPSPKAKMANGQAWLLVAATFVAAFLGALAAVLIGKLF